MAENTILVDAILDDLEASREGIKPVESSRLNTFKSLWEDTDRDIICMYEEHLPIKEESFIEQYVNHSMHR